MDGFLLDSVILIWWVRKLHSAPAIVEELRREKALYISSLSIIEVLRSVEPHEEERARTVLARTAPVAVDERIARWAVDYLQRTGTEGYRVDYISAAIAATATVNDLILVTYNFMHYPLLEARLYPLGAFS